MHIDDVSEALSAEPVLFIILIISFNILFFHLIDINFCIVWKAFKPFSTLKLSIIFTFIFLLYACVWLLKASCLLQSYKAIYDDVDLFIFLHKIPNLLCKMTWFSSKYMLLYFYLLFTTKIKKVIAVQSRLCSVYMCRICLCFVFRLSFVWQCFCALFLYRYI